MEDIGSLKYILQEYNFMGKIDAYLSVLIHQEYKVLLDTDDLPVQIFFMQQVTGEGINDDAPVWLNQTWFTTLLTKAQPSNLSCWFFKDIITNSVGETYPLIKQNSLHLGTCRVTGQVYMNKKIQMNLSELFW